MTTTNTSTVVALFDSRIAAEKAVRELSNAGYSRDMISVVARDDRTPGSDIPNIGPQPELTGTTDAGSGAAVGGFAGFIGGLVALAIPGIGPALAIGPLAAGILGASAGAAAGGLYGALKQHGVPEADVSRFSEAVRRGRVLVLAHVPTERVDHAADLLDQTGALDVDEPVEHVDVPQAVPNPIRPLTPEAAEAIKFQPEDSLRERQRARQRRSTVYPGFTGMGPASTT